MPQNKHTEISKIIYTINSQDVNEHDKKYNITLKNKSPPPSQSIGVRVIMFNATFYNISVIKWQSVLLVEYTEKNH